MGLLVWRKMNDIYLSEDTFMHSTFIIHKEEINNET